MTIFLCVCKHLHIYPRNTMKLLVLLLLHCIARPLLAYRDGARDNSCYDHSIDHGAGTETFPCDPPPARDPCPFFLRIREVMDEATLELGNETSTYQCGRIYGSKEKSVQCHDVK